MSEATSTKETSERGGGAGWLSGRRGGCSRRRPAAATRALTAALVRAPRARAVLDGRHPFALPGDRPVWGRDRPFAVEHIALDLAFNLARGEVRGVATTTFRPRVDGLREAVFDAIELDVESVEDGTGRALPFTVGERTLRVDLGRPRSSRRRITTVVRYSARPRRGLYFNAPEAAYPDRPRQIWTQGQAEDSAYYFPCFDYPGEKATSELTVTVPAGWFALSNGRLESQSERPPTHASRRSTGCRSVPHPAYLFSLAAGEFDVVEDERRGRRRGRRRRAGAVLRPAGQPAGRFASRVRQHAGDGALLRGADRRALSVRQVRDGRDRTTSSSVAWRTPPPRR